MPKKQEAAGPGDDLYLLVAQKLQAGRTGAEVRKLLAKRNVPAEEARTMVLNVYAAQKLQQGCKPSEVRQLLQEEDATREKARVIVAELRRGSGDPAREKGRGGGGSHDLTARGRRSPSRRATAGHGQ